jgi:hypothetical protein
VMADTIGQRVAPGAAFTAVFRIDVA